MWSAGARRRRQRVGSSRSPIDDRSPGPKASVLRARHDDAADECRDRCFAVERVRAVHDQAGLDGPLDASSGSITSGLDAGASTVQPPLVMTFAHVDGGPADPRASR